MHVRKWVTVTCLPPPVTLVNLVCRIEIEDSEAVGISSIISNLITVFPRNVLTAIPSELFSSFVNCLTHLTCSFGRSAALEEVVSGHSEVHGVCCSQGKCCAFVTFLVTSNFQAVVAAVEIAFLFICANCLAVCIWKHDLKILCIKLTLVD